MDYLNPKKQFRQNVLLFVGYFLCGVAIIIATVILLYQAYGFGLGKNGTIIQNGLLFFSSQPHPADLYINGKANPSRTNTRLVLPAATYHVKISLPGYRSWQRSIVLLGGSVQHYDYPLLFPTTLVTKKLSVLPSAPQVMSESPDQHWLLISEPSVADAFRLYDMTNLAKSPVILTLPATAYSKASTPADSWHVVSWADDNQHVLLLHSFDGKTEYVLLDRSDPTKSINVSQALSPNTYTTLSLLNNKYDQYVLYNAADLSLHTASLQVPAATLLATHVIAYHTYGMSTVLYVTPDGTLPGRVTLKEVTNGQTYSLQTFTASPTYVLNLTTYNGRPYVAAGASNENKVYIYTDPIGQLLNQPLHPPVPSAVLHINDPTYMSFSNNAQFIAAESGQQFAVYNIENTHSYTYTMSQPLDSPQTHASWMDGDRLVYVSAGHILVFDYNQANEQSLMAANPSYSPAYPADYSSIVTLVNPPVSMTSPAGTNILTNTSLLVP